MWSAACPAKRAGSRSPDLPLQQASPACEIFSALLTPFDDRERIDPAATESLVAFQRSQGVQGFYVGGSSGEAMLQSQEERAEYLHLMAGIVGGGLPLIAHVGAIATSDTLALAGHAAKAGYRRDIGLLKATGSSGICVGGGDWKSGKQPHAQ